MRPNQFYIDLAAMASSAGRVLRYVVKPPKVPAVEQPVQKSEIRKQIDTFKPKIIHPITEPRKILEQSKVPSTRLGRIYEFSTLGLSLSTSMLKNRIAGSSNLLTPDMIEKIVQKLTKMRGAALKLGQMLSIQDSESISPEISTILKRVQNSANYMPDSQFESTMVRNLGSEWRTKFKEFGDVPIAAASIGQVHVATLHDGTKVAVKVQYPGVSKSIDSDLNNLVMLLSLGKLLPKGLYLDNTIRVARQELALECDYIREADSMERFSSLLESSGLNRHFHVPKVYRDLSTTNVLVTEFVNGYTIDKCVELSEVKKNQVVQTNLAGQ